MTTPEDRAREIVGRYMQPLGIDGASEDALEGDIAQALREAETRGMERAAEIAESERVSGETGEETDAAYNLAVEHIAAAIRAAKEEA